jgi:hypothetical protein
MGALAKYRYTASGEPVAPEGHPREWRRWLLEINSVEFKAINDHVDDGDILDMKPVNELASSGGIQRPTLTPPIRDQSST